MKKSLSVSIESHVDGKTRSNSKKKNKQHSLHYTPQSLHTFVHFAMNYLEIDLDTQRYM